MRLVSIAVPVPFLDLLTYRVPAHLEMPPVGARVRVPLGTRTVTGCVVETGVQITDDRQAPPADVKDLVAIVDREPFLPGGIVDLCRWVADYYLAGIGDAIAVALPPGARDKASGFRMRRVASLTAHGRSAVSSAAADPEFRLTPKQREALEALAAASVSATTAPEVHRPRAVWSVLWRIVSA